jgi:hypothetical protein
MTKLQDKNYIYYHQETEQEILDLQSKFTAEELGFYFIFKSTYIKFKGIIPCDKLAEYSQKFNEKTKYIRFVYSISEVKNGFIIKKSFDEIIEKIIEKSDKSRDSVSQRKESRNQYTAKLDKNCKAINYATNDATKNVSNDASSFATNVNVNVNDNILSQKTVKFLTESTQCPIKICEYLVERERDFIRLKDMVDTRSRMLAIASHVKNLEIRTISKAFSFYQENANNKWFPRLLELIPHLNQAKKDILKEEGGQKAKQEYAEERKLLDPIEKNILNICRSNIDKAIYEQYFEGLMLIGVKNNVMILSHPERYKAKNFEWNDNFGIMKYLKKTYPTLKRIEVIHEKNKPF